MSEDLRPSGDVTTQLIKNNKKIKVKIISNQKCVVGGLDFAKETFKYSDKRVNFKTKTKDGKKINKGKIVAIIYGKAKGILKSERVALNFLSLISGVATTTKKFVDKVKGKSCKICCTRKTSPNLRLIQKYGVRLGGGLNHRFNLSDEILIKDNHIAIDGNIRELVKRAIKNKKGKSSITEGLTQGQEIVVQVDKEERGTKGAALTTFISLPGHYLVLMPNNPEAGGISRSLEGKARDEVKENFRSLDVPEDMGFIARTSAHSSSLDEL